MDMDIRRSPTNSFKTAAVGAKVGAAWGSGELLIDGRQCIHKARLGAVCWYHQKHQLAKHRSPFYVDDYSTEQIIVFEAKSFPSVRWATYRCKSHIVSRIGSCNQGHSWKNKVSRTAGTAKWNLLFQFAVGWKSFSFHFFFPATSLLLSHDWSIDLTRTNSGFGDGGFRDDSPRNLPDWCFWTSGHRGAFSGGCLADITQELMVKITDFTSNF